MKTYISWFCVFCFGLLLCNCNVHQTYPDTPEIHYKNLILEERTDPNDNVSVEAILFFSFIDGNGDIGKRPYDEDGISLIRYKWYKKLSDNNYEEYKFNNDSIYNSSDIPYGSVMNKSEAQNKTLKGSIEIELSTPFEIEYGMPMYHGLEEIDTMYVEFYITDRAQNKSNVERTPDFSILPQK